MRTIHREIVGAFIFSADDKLLLGKAGVYEGFWVVPGGGIDEGETNRDALEREVLEETGILLTDAEIIVLDKPPQTGTSEKVLRDTGERVQVSMTFYDFAIRLPQDAADITVHADDDFREPRWFGRKELSGLQLTPSIMSTLQHLGYLPLG